MGVDFSLWLSDTAAIPASGRAAAAWARINDKPTSVTFRKPDGTDLDAQTVRLEYDSRVSESESPAGQTPVRKLIIFGVKDHDTVTDTDIGEGYRFNYQSDAYRVVDIIYTIGEVQAVAEAIG